jgi:hypothetical protein
MDLTQFGRIKTELKQRFYEQNKIAGTYLQLTIGGLAEKIPETQQIVLMNRSKIKVKPKKRRWLYV